jgi:hypothetical protein
MRSSICQRGHGYLVHRGSSKEACFHASNDDWLVDSPLRSYWYDSGSISHEATPLQSSFNSTTALAFRLKQLPTWVSTLFSTSLQRVHVRGTPNPTLFRPQAFTTSRRFTPLCSLRAYFIPQPSPGPLPVQGLPTLHSRLTSSVSACPHVVEARRAHPQADSTNQASQLRGFAPCRAACRQFGN